MFDRMPQLAEGVPSRAALNELPSAIRNAPFAQLEPASPIGQRLEPGWIGPVALDRDDHGQVAPRVGRDDLGIELLPVGRANDQLPRPAHHVEQREDLPVVADHHSRPEIERDQAGRIGHRQCGIRASLKRSDCRAVS